MRGSRLWADHALGPSVLVPTTPAATGCDGGRGVAASYTDRFEGGSGQPREGAWRPGHLTGEQARGALTLVAVRRARHALAGVGLRAVLCAS